MSLTERLAVAIVAVLPIATDALAGGQRSFVASYGTNTGTCTPTAPCRSFDYAITQTLAGGEIIVLDSAGYGGLTIAKSITITAPPGVYAGITAIATTGINVSAGPSDTVVLRGLTINGLPGATLGIVVNSDSLVRVERCAITGFDSAIQYNGSGDNGLVIADCEFSGNGVGIQAAAAGGTNGRLEIVRSRFHDNVQTAISVDNVYRTVVVDTFVGHNNNGIAAHASAAATSNINVSVERSTVVDNANNGIVADATGGPTAVVNFVNGAIVGNGVGVHAPSGGYIRVSGTQINANLTGAQVDAGGNGATLGTNMLYGNTTNGAFNSTLTPN